MKSGDILLIVAILAVIVSVIGVGITYNYIGSLKNKLTGFAAGSGTINLSIESVVTINFTTDIINWSSGMVAAGNQNATLCTSWYNLSNVSNGNWTGNTAGLIIENIGNNNVSLNISAGKDAAELLGGTSPLYQLNFTNVEPNSCLNFTGGTDQLTYLGSFQTANTTQRIFCGKLSPADGSDSLRIDVKLVIPSNSKVGTLSDTITATFAQN